MTVFARFSASDLLWVHRHLDDATALAIEVIADEIWLLPEDERLRCIKKVLVKIIRDGADSNETKAAKIFYLQILLELKQSGILLDYDGSKTS